MSSYDDGYSGRGINSRRSSSEQQEYARGQYQRKKRKMSREFSYFDNVSNSAKNASDAYKNATDSGASPLALLFWTIVFLTVFIALTIAVR